MRAILLIFLLIAPILGFSQQSMSIALREHLESADKNELIHLAAKAPYGEIKEWCTASGSTCRKAVGGKVLITLKAALVTDLLEQGFVSEVEFSWAKGTVMNDTMRVRNKINGIQNGNGGLPQPYDGEGVVIGYIDGGLDWNHPDFLNPDSSTRVVYVWKQFQAPNFRTPLKYGYGRLYDSVDINTGIVGIGGQYVDHGSTVTGTGSGNAFANGRHKGVAPKSDIIVVSSDFSASGWTQTVADAVDFIVSYADSMGKPAVINASLGTYSGSHDGKDAAAQYIDSLLTDKKGRIMAAAAGNSGNWGPYHLRYPVTGDTAFTWFSVNSSLWTGSPGVFLDIWADTLDYQNIDISIAADKMSPNYERRGITDFFNVADYLNNTIVDTILNGTDTLAFVEYFATVRGGQYNVQVYIEDPDSSQYNFALLTTGTGIFDLWSHENMGLNNIDTSINTTPGFTNQADYRLPDSSGIIVSSWACSPKVITVGNYYSYLGYDAYSGNFITLPGQVGDIAITSSDGPTRTGMIKPDVASTGDLTMSAVSLSTLNTWQTSFPDYVDQGGWHVRNGGTSMASPVVAGLAALYLQHCPEASVADFKQRLLTNTDLDGFTGAVPNNTFGYGKVNGLRTIQGTLYSPQILGDTSFCTGGNAILETQNFYDNWAWSTGDSTGQIQVTQQDSVWVITRDSSWCPGFSDTVFVVEHPVPPQPSIIVDGDTLITDAASFHQWYLNNGMIGGANDSTYVINASGDYFVEVYNQYGCSSNSDTIYVSGVGITEEDFDVRVYPNPTTEGVYIESTIGSGSFVLHDLVGKLCARGSIHVGDRARVDMTGWNTGIYLLTIKSDTYTRTLKIIKR